MRSPAGLAPDRVIHVEAGDEKALLACFEEGLRHGGLGAVVAETIEDETGVANVVVWAKVFERFRRVMLGVGVIGIKGRIQREGEVVHVVARDLFDLSKELANIGAREVGFPLPNRQSNEFREDSAVPGAPVAAKARNLGAGYGHPNEIHVRTRDFR